MFRLDRIYRPLPLGAVHNVAVTLSRSCSVVVMRRSLPRKEYLRLSTVRVTIADEAKPQPFENAMVVRRRDCLLPLPCFWVLRIDVVVIQLDARHRSLHVGG